MSEIATFQAGPVEGMVESHTEPRVFIEAWLGVVIWELWV